MIKAQNYKFVFEILGFKKEDLDDKQGMKTITKKVNKKFPNRVQIKYLF